jgi:alanyl-tRNA synthetase
MDFISKNSENFDERPAKIITDHIKSSIFIISEDVIPSNAEHGYILRRLLRKSIILSDKIGFEKMDEIVDIVSNQYKEIYHELNDIDKIKKIINEEIEKFRSTLKKGLKEFEKISSNNISGEDAFILSSTYGFPIELIKDMANGKKVQVDVLDFEKRMQKHKDKSRTAAVGKFKGGLEGDGEIEKRYHTATHLLHQALREVLGEHVQQKGSNINSERLRFDFSHNQKMTDEEKEKVEKIVNEKISEQIPVNMVEMIYEEALKTEALHFFSKKYSENVSIYYIGENMKDAYSKEFCGGPHVKNTSEIGELKIKKEEASSNGVRRIKAVLK